jgi:hypothetical protein
MSEIVVLALILVPGVIGAVLARRWGYGAGLGLAAGTLGGAGGWMLVAALPRRTGASPRAADPDEPPRPRSLAAADRGAHLLYGAVAILLAGFNVVWLGTMAALALAPLRFESLLLAEPGIPMRVFDVALVGMFVMLGVLCVYTAATDRRLTRGARAGWLAALLLTLFGAAPGNVHERRARGLRETGG